MAKERLTQRIDCFAYITFTPALLTGVLLADALMVGVAKTNEGGEQ